MLIMIFFIVSIIKKKGKELTYRKFVCFFSSSSISFPGHSGHCPVQWMHVIGHVKFLPKCYIDHITSHRNTHTYTCTHTHKRTHTLTHTHLHTHTEKHTERTLSWITEYTPWSHADNASVFCFNDDISLSLSLTHTHTHTYTHTHTHTHSHTHILKNTCMQVCAWMCTHTHTHTLGIYMCIYSISLSLEHTYTHAHADTNTHTHTCLNM